MLTDLERLDDARLHVHTVTCGVRVRPAGTVRPFPCLGCPSPAAVAAALAVLDQRPRDAHGVRLVLHDAVCLSGGRDCSSRDDHARRTQTQRAAALRRFHRDERAGR